LEASRAQRGGGGHPPWAAWAVHMEAEGQKLEQQLTSLSRRFEMFKATMTMEVKDLERQLEGMRQSTRQRMLDHAADMELRLRNQLPSQIREDVLADVAACIHSARSDLAQRVEHVESTVKADVRDLERKLGQMRKSLMEDFVDLGQRPVFDFVQAMQGSMRQELEDMQSQIEAIRATAARFGTDAGRQVFLRPAEVGLKSPVNLGSADIFAPHQQQQQQQQHVGGGQPPELTGTESQQGSPAHGLPGAALEKAAPPAHAGSAPLVQCLQSMHASLRLEIAGLREELRGLQRGAGAARSAPSATGMGAGGGAGGGNAAADSLPPECAANGCTEPEIRAAAMVAEWLGAEPGACGVHAAWDAADREAGGGGSADAVAFLSPRG